MRPNRLVATVAVSSLLLAADGISQIQSDHAVVLVDAARPWTDTGIDVVAYDSPIRVTASGWIDVGLVSRRLFTPKGDPDCRGHLGTPFSVPSLPCWALLGRIGLNGEPFLVGRGATVEPKELGRLFLGVNDESFYFADNAGHWTATVALARSASDAPPAPAALAANADVVAAIRKAFSGAAGNTMLQRIDARDAWKIRTPAFDQPLPPRVVEIAATLPRGPERLWEDTDLALRQGIDAIDALTAPELGVAAKSFLIRVMMESLVDAAPLLPTDEVAKLGSALERAVREGLSKEVQDLLGAGKRPGYLVCAVAKPCVTIHMRGQDDLLMIRYRATDGATHVYDVFATWTERCAAGAKDTVYGDIRIADGQQGYARHEVMVTRSDDGALAVKSAPLLAHYATNPDGLWLRGDLAAVR